MRRLADAAKLQQLLASLGRAAKEPSTLYLVGGATAVLHGWRANTLDVDLEVVPESSEILRAIPGLKRSLALNVELAAPHHFIPPLPGWRERSPFVAQHGPVTVRHYDLYSQALAKIERGHQQDREDVTRMLAERLVEPVELRRLFAAIEPDLYRYPAIDPGAFRRSLEEALAGSARPG